MIVRVKPNFKIADGVGIWTADSDFRYTCSCEPAFNADRLTSRLLPLAGLFLCSFISYFKVDCVTLLGRRGCLSRSVWNVSQEANFNTHIPNKPRRPRPRGCHGTRHSTQSLFLDRQHGELSFVQLLCCYSFYLSYRLRINSASRVRSYTL